MKWLIAAPTLTRPQKRGSENRDSKKAQTTCMPPSDNSTNHPNKPVRVPVCADTQHRHYWQHSRLQHPRRSPENHTHAQQDQGNGRVPTTLPDGTEQGSGWVCANILAPVSQLCRAHSTWVSQLSEHENCSQAGSQAQAAPDQQRRPAPTALEAHMELPLQLPVSTG